MEYLEQLKKVEQQRAAIRRVSRDRWLLAWQELAAVTNGISRDDRRYHPALSGLAQCDAAFERGDWLAFEQATERVKHIMKGAS
jgi:hypothetical protein